MKYKKRIVFGVLFLIFAAFVYRTSVVRLTKNFHEVDPGRFYRSAQLDPAELEEAIDRYGIKTVISLRGAPKNSYWYPGQVEVLERKKVKFLAVGWTSDYFPHADDLKTFIKALKEEQYPILVHCRTGADRTGEATAIYAIDYMNIPKDEAIAKYLSFTYWHVPLFHPAKIEFVRRYQGYDWAMNVYSPCATENKQWAEPGQCPP